MSSIKETLELAKIASANKEIEESSIRLLLMEVNNLSSNSELILAYNNEMQNVDLFREYFARLLNGEPVQYIIQKSHFLNDDYYVDGRVLIPRMETEELVLKVVEVLNSSKKTNPVVLDIGTGSGCIAISIKKLCPKAIVYASDISKEALDVAKINSGLLKTEIIFIEGNLLFPFIQRGIKADVIVSNPPYIESESEADAIVANFEPKQALFVSPSTYYYQKILLDSKFVLYGKSTLCFEIGYNQKDALEELIKKLTPNATYDFYKDISGKDRIAVIEFDSEKKCEKGR